MNMEFPSDEQFRLQCGEMNWQDLANAKAGYRMAMSKYLGWVGDMPARLMKPHGFSQEFEDGFNSAVDLVDAAIPAEVKKSWEERHLSMIRQALGRE